MGNNVETQKAIKKYQGQIRDAQGKLEEESRGKAIGHDQLVAADRKAHAMQNALEEARSLLEIADRNRRMTNKNSLMPTNHCPTQPFKTNPLPLLRENWKPK